MDNQLIRFFEGITWGTETSKYPKEKKSNEILLVMANENRIGQAESNIVIYLRCGFTNPSKYYRIVLKNSTIKGDSPVYDTLLA